MAGKSKDRADRLNTRSNSSPQLFSDSPFSDETNVEASEESKRCGKCNRVVRKDAKAVCCEYCSLWYHIKCEGISDEIYNFF